MRKITLAVSALMFGLLNTNAQTSCVDQNGYVNSKNTGPTGFYTLEEGMEEKASQTYQYSGPGKITSVRVHGSYPGLSSGVPLRVGIYEVDANGRPTDLLYSTNNTWWWFDNFTGYINVNIGGGGVFIDSDFAITVEVRNAFPWGDEFQLKYTGDGEGDGEDLASLAGTSTGFNWSSAMTSFSKDGDFYLEPKMTHFINPEFDADKICVQTGEVITFSNESMMSADRMFNLISEVGYSGSNFLYSWNFGDGSPVSHSMNPIHSYSTSGVKTVTLTATIEGWNNTCTATFTKQISVGLSASATSSPATCFGDFNGSLTANVIGGASPFQYSIDGENYQSGTTFTGLEAAFYTVYVTDHLGCEVTAFATVNEPTEIVISNVSSTNASCGTSNGSIQVTASGGTGTLQYQLNSGSYQTSNTFSSLPSGFYTIHVKDANGCISTIQKLVSDQGAPSMVILSQTNVSCNNGNDGTINVLATGGSGTLQYSSNGGSSWSTNHNFTGLLAGTHSLMVKDAASCTSGMSITLTEPEAISFNLASTPVSCFDGANGSINVNSIIGGTGSFSYSLNGSTFQSGSTFSGLAAGTYTVTARDIAGCIKTSPISISEPTALIANSTVTNAICNGSFDGTITVNASGGTGDYMYSINEKDYQYENVFGELEVGAYEVIVVDENGCELIVPANITQPSIITTSITTGTSTCGNNNGTLLVTASGGSGSGYQYSLDGINFSPSGTFSSLAAGGYFVVVNDGNGCTNVFNTNINDADGPVFTSVSNTDVACHNGENGSISVNSVTGGTGTLQYSINGTSWQTSTTFTNLEAGTYSLLVKDANGCIGESTIVINEPNAFTITATTTDAVCHGSNTGTAVINAAGGSGTLAYSIHNGFNYVSSNTFSNLGEGNYTVIVRDAAGCTGSVSFTIDEPRPILIITSELDITCNGSEDGMLYVNASGGTGTLQYSMNGTSYQSNNNFTIISGGVYFIFVRDANGCVQFTQASINEPDPIEVNSNISDVSCAGGDNGVIDLVVSGGIYPYSYEWSDLSTNEDDFNLESGNYSVEVTDHNGCTVIESFTVTEPTNPLIINGTITPTFSQMSSDGVIDITVTGGTSPYTFNWDNGSSSEDISGLNPGVYTVAITDANGCSASETFIVSIGTGVETTDLINVVQLYPNPAREYFSLDGGTFKIQQAEILNVIGQVITSVSPNSTKVQMNISDLENGIYFVRITADGKTIIKKVEVIK
jgi:hypothetical protein